MKVNLITRSKELQNRMIEDYPGVLREEQVQPVHFSKRKAYYFTNLEFSELSKFLSKIEESFEVRDSERNSLILAKKGNYFTINCLGTINLN